MNWYKKAKKLEDVELVGKLKQADNGFVFLDINDNIMEGLFQLIDEDGLEKPPYHQKKYNSIGTHISIMTEDETKDLNIKEVGREFNFALGDLKSTDPEGWDEMETVFFVNIYSEDLQKLRAKYNLPKKLDGHEFHITVAVEKE
jgi:hypothetical protein